MAYYLDSIASSLTRYVTIPSVTFTGDFEVKVIAAQLGAGSNGTFIFAGSGVAGQNGLDLYRNSSGNYQLFINNTAAIGTTTPVTNSITAPDTVIVRRLSGVVDLIINGVSRGTFSTSAALAIERLFHRNGWANYGRMGLYEFTITSGGSYNSSWSPSNSPSGGSTWISSAGQVMTQAGSWPANDSEWIFYSSGATAYSDTLLAGSYTSSGGELASTRGYGDTLTGGSYSYSGGLLISTFSGAEQSYIDTLLGGSYASSGAPLTSNRDYVSQLAGGSYTSAGGSLSAFYGYSSTLNGGSYTSAGNRLISTWSGEVTVTIEGYTIRFADDSISARFHADDVSATFDNDNVSVTWRH